VTAHHCRHLLCTATVLVTLLAISQRSMAADIVSVVSSDAAPYRAAQDALARVLSSEGHLVRPVALEVLTAKGLGDLGAAAVVIAIGTPAAVWLHERKPAIPLTFCLVSGPERAGLLTPPPASGVTTDIPLSEQVQVLRQTLPGLTGVGTLYRQDDPASVQDLEAMRRALPEGVRLEAVAIDRHPTPAKAIDDLLGRRIDVVWTAPDSSIWNEATVRSLLLTALRRRVPVFGFSTPFVRAGALVGVGLDPAQQGTQAGNLVLDLLAGRGVNGQIIAPRFEISLNLVVAQKLAITIPRELQERATHLFGGAR
jgi:ABC-type uncharacterized transport system substrate-binding protein